MGDVGEQPSRNKTEVCRSAGKISDRQGGDRYDISSLVH
jgi:hypothetical protein